MNVYKKELKAFDVYCQADGTFLEPVEWPKCVASKKPTNHICLYITFLQYYVILIYNIWLQYYNKYFMLIKSGVNCDEPPARPYTGTWEWNGNSSYGTKISYTCGPYAKFCDDDGVCLDEIISKISYIR